MKKFEHLFFDLDGVIYLGNKPIERAASSIKLLSENGFKIYFVTNNATKSRSQIAQKLRGFKIKANKNQIISSAFAAAQFAKKLNFSEAFVIGEDGLKKELLFAGLKVSSKPKFDKKAVLVSGLDRNFNYNQLKIGLRLILSGSKWIACNLDPTYPVEDGIDPGAGSLAGALAFGAGKISKDGLLIPTYPDYVVGKPNKNLLSDFLKENNIKNALYVGDRIDIDVLFAKNLAIKSALVLSGISKKSDISFYKKHYHISPDFVFDSIADLTKYLID